MKCKNITPIKRYACGFDKRLELYSRRNAGSDFHGNVLINHVKITDIWCNIETKSGTSEFNSISIDGDTVTHIIQTPYYPTIANEFEEVNCRILEPINRIFLKSLRVENVDQNDRLLIIYATKLGDAEKWQLQ